METCDTCGPAVKAVFRVHKGDLVLTLCAHHLHSHLDGLLQSGWTVYEIGTLVPVLV